MPISPGVFMDSAEIVDTLRAASEDGTLDGPDGAWDSLIANGTPLIDPDSDRRTFVWRPPAGMEVPEGAWVHLHINRITDKDFHSRGLMRSVPGTDIWTLTVSLPETLRASYGFTIRYPEEASGHRPPKHNHYDTFRDLHSRVHPLVRDGEFGGLSVVVGRLAPSLPEWESGTSPLSDDKLRGSITTTELELRVDDADDGAAGPLRRCHLYLPDPDDVRGPVSLVTVFDAESWFTRLHLPAALERARETRALPPVAVLGLTAADIPDRKATLGANRVFLREVATTGTEWAERRGAVEGIGFAPPSARIVAGQSLGGLSALCAARDLGEFYGHAIAQSPSMWWTPDGKSKPPDLVGCTTPWITGTFPSAAGGEAPRPHIYLDVGLRETHTVPHMHTLGMHLAAARWPHVLNFYDGGHDNAWWRSSLLDRLTDILVPRR